VNGGISTSHANASGAMVTGDGGADGDRRYLGIGKNIQIFD
jgi:hypothetical protein